MTNTSLLAPLGDIVWPGLVLTFWWASVPIIVASLLIEWPVFKLIFNAPWLRALYATLLANTASFVLGAVLVPLGTLGFESVTYVIFPQPTASALDDTVTTFVAALICTAIEYPVAAWFLKGSYRFRNILAVYAANLITVGIAAAMVFHAGARSVH